MEKQETTKLITLTEAAAEAVRELLEDRDLTGYGLRVFLSGGGCSGYQYGMSLDKDLIENDTVLEQHGVKLMIDDVSIQYLAGATVDFITNEYGSGFQINNPNPLPASSCGCGSGEAQAYDSCGCGSDGHGGGSGCGCGGGC
ncbi:MAG: iron-sulfur cluster assembly accessory protein [Anaerolineales bacterium]|nr:iron-sulfur cluster assembly accessory protein [Anaerolineales bacterium]